MAIRLGRGLMATIRSARGRSDARARAELGNDGVCVNTLTPDDIPFDRDYDNRQPEMAPGLAEQRVFRARAETGGHGRDALYLLGPGSDFVTGQDVWVNGGRAFS